MSINNSNIPLSKIVIKLQGSPKIQIFLNEPLLLRLDPRNAEPRVIITYKMEQLSRQFPVQLLDEERIGHMFFRNQIIAQLFCTNADVQTSLVSPMHYARWIIRVIIKRLTDNYYLLTSI